MTKSIFINGRFLAQPQTGVQRYATEVMKALDGLIERKEIDASGYSLVVLAPPEPCVALPLKHIEVRTVGRLKGNLWEQIDLPWHARSGLLFSPCNIGPVLHFNQVVTIHDASVYAVPEAYSFGFRMKYQVIFWILGKTARHIFTDSQFSKNEIIRYCHIAAEKIQVVYLSAEHILLTAADPGVFEKYGIGQRPYVLAVSSNSPHKNFAGLVKATELLGEVEFDVVIVGGTYSKVFEAQDIVVPSFVKRIGYVSDPELRALYERAACFVYPSYYEGFGLPPLEAMSLGCPVVVSNAASLPEVCGDAAIYFDPENAQDIAQKILKITCEPTLRPDMKQKQQEHIKRFAWKRSVMTIWIEIFKYAS